MESAQTPPSYNGTQHPQIAASALRLNKRDGSDYKRTAESYEKRAAGIPA